MSYKYLLKINGKELDLKIEKDNPLTKGQTVTLRGKEIDGEYEVIDINDVFCSEGDSFMYAGLEFTHNVTVLSLVSKLSEDSGPPIIEA